MAGEKDAHRSAATCAGRQKGTGRWNCSKTFRSSGGAIELVEMASRRTIGRHPSRRALAELGPSSGQTAVSSRRPNQRFQLVIPVIIPDLAIQNLARRGVRQFVDEQDRKSHV